MGLWIIVLTSSDNDRDSGYSYLHLLAMTRSLDTHTELLNPLGAQWLSGRVLDSRPKGSGFEPHRRHCVVVLEQDTFILA